MCTRFHIDPNNPEIREVAEQALRSPLVEQFLQATGKRILTSGEIRPTNIVPVIAPNQKGEDSAFPMKWGFDLFGKSVVVNARVETAATKPAFRQSWEKRRCIIPASWYYEWTHLIDRNGKKVVGDKIMFRPRGSTVTYLAGLYRIEQGLPCFTVLTREATKELRVIHDRMPVILEKSLIHDWISPNGNPEALVAHAVTDMVAGKA